MAGGNWIVDQVKIIDILPQRDKLANILDQAEGTGGSPYNLLVNLSRLGAPFPLLAAGLVGKDAVGQSIIKDCRRNKISARYLSQTDQAPSSYTDVMSEKETGRRTFFHQRGTNALWDGKDLVFDQIPAKIFHLGYLLLLDALDAPNAKFGTRAAALLAKAKSSGMMTSIDVASEDSDRFGKIVKPALKHVDYCIINEFEAGKITGFQCRDASEKLDTVAVRHAAGAILQCGVSQLVVIHFPEGAFARTFDGKDLAGVYPELAPGDYVEIEVTDTGNGMPKEVQARIFDPFFTTKSAGKGTGLGLSMVFGYMKQIGGHIAVNSEPGHGTTFRLYPRRGVIDNRRTTEIATRVEFEAHEKGLIVLVVDDNADVREASIALFESLGYLTIPAAGAEEALDKLSQNPGIALLFTDLVMPGLDGKEVVRHIRESERSRTPVIGISGTPWLLETADFNSVLAKPFSIVSLVQHLQELAPA